MAKKQYKDPTAVDEQLGNLKMQLLIINGEIAHYEAYKLDLVHKRLWKDCYYLPSIESMKKEIEKLEKELEAWELLK